MGDIAFIEEPTRAIIDKRGVKITYKSGSDVFVRRMSIEDYRVSIAAGVQLLREYDASQRERVVPLRGRQRGH